MRANPNLPDDGALLHEHQAGATMTALATKYGTSQPTISRHIQAASTEATETGTLLTAVPDWHQAAACADPQTPPDMFFPDAGHPARLAKAICGPCPVRQLCLQWALDTYEPHGIWGGHSPMERRRLLRRRTA